MVVGGTLYGEFNSNGFLVQSGSLFIQEGSVGVPGMRFDTDQNTGIYRIGADDLGISIGGAQHTSFSANGVLLKTANDSFAAQNPTNTGVYNVGGDAGVPLPDESTFTFTMNKGGLFVLTNSNQEQIGVFAADYTNAVVEIADPSGKFTPTDTDNGDNIAVYKSASSQVVTVKNYTGLTRSIFVNFLGVVTSATAP